MSIDEEITASLQDWSPEAWQGVAGRVAADVCRWRDKAAMLLPHASIDVGIILDLDDGSVIVAGEDQTAARKVAFALSLDGIEVEVCLPSAISDNRRVAFCKSAEGGILAPVGKVWDSLHYPFGGASPLSTALIGGALTGAAAYGTGALLEHVLPEDKFDVKGMRNRFGLLGLGVGALPGMYLGAKQYSNDPAFPGTATTPASTFQQTLGAGWTTPFSKWKALAQIPNVGREVPDSANISPLDNTKYAADGDGGFGGSMFMPTIPVDAFNQTVWNDVNSPKNIFGSKSQWGSNEQSLGTPLPVASAVSGLVSGAGAMRDQHRVSPFDVAISAASSGAKGWLGATLLGKTVGALAGLRPEYQDKLQSVGLWGGLLTGAVRAAF